MTIAVAEGRGAISRILLKSDYTDRSSADYADYADSRLILRIATGTCAWLGAF